jgi:hypothetical protein
MLRATHTTLLTVGAFVYVDGGPKSVTVKTIYITPVLPALNDRTVLVTDGCYSLSAPLAATL